MARVRHQFRIMRQPDGSYHIEVRSFNPRHWLYLTGFPWWSEIDWEGSSFSEAQYVVEHVRRIREASPVEVKRY